MDRKVARALEIIGAKAEGYAKNLCAVDTGLLRNSITHTRSDGTAAISDYKADKEKNGERGEGSYSGRVPFGNEKAVYIGTNVEYAPYVEYGTSQSKKGPQPFIRPAVQDHIDEYKHILNMELGS